MHLPFSPYIRIAWYSTLEPHTIIGPRDIFDYELLYLKEGSAVITIEDTVYNAVPGDVFLFRPRQRHTIHCVNDFSVIQPHVHFDLHYQPDSPDVFVSYKSEEKMTEEQKHFFREDILEEYYPNLPSCIHSNNNKLFESYLFDLIDEYSHPSPQTELRQQWLFLRLFDLYVSEASYSLHLHNISGSESTAQRIKLYLDNNTTSRISLDELASVSHLDKSYLVNLFKRVYHETPVAYHQKIRIKKAQDMLLYTNLSVTQVAAATGFLSIHDFDRVFRKITGSTPSSFRTRT